MPDVPIAAFHQPAVRSCFECIHVVLRTDADNRAISSRCSFYDEVIDSEVNAASNCPTYEEDE